MRMAAWLGVIGTLAVGCSAEDRAPRSTPIVGAKTGVDAGAAEPDFAAAPIDEEVPGRCTPARAAEPLPARPQVTSAEVVATKRTMATDDLRRRVDTFCGSCHLKGTKEAGRFFYDEKDFATKFDLKALATIRANDPAIYMPPAGSPNAKPFDLRGPTDPLVELARLIEIWIDQGRPAQTFDLPGGDEVAATGYKVTPEIGAAFTNIGTCIPEAKIVATLQKSMAEMDAFFAAATELPARLEQTDLVTFESEALARRGVISFAPAYPLWSDDAGKMRHVRAPRGTSIKFDKSKQAFAIPPHTRFYKTFLKKVTDRDGNPTYRKIETRLVVARPDKTLPDGTVESTALFGTYVWDENETEAVLLTDPLREGKPFADRLLSYDVHEPEASALRAERPKDWPRLIKTDKYKGVTRTYAVPGRDRCIQCHMGSPTADFVLGFTPLQVARRAVGEGGVIEHAEGDELTQLQRLIDYKLVTGLSSPEEVTKLEASQGARKPRTDEELAAQGYMLGNCASCHNPRGFPSMRSEALRAGLNFLPGPDENAGIFGFSLERASPRIFRGINQDIPVHYITPSLRELGFGTPAVPDLPNEAAATNDTDFRKRVSCADPAAGCAETKPGSYEPIAAPWRSLIYRNVDAPFMYADANAIYPHMPMHVPGFDCRAPRIMGEWMVSLPSVLADASIEEGAPVADMQPQPYVEVPAGADGHEEAQAAARARLEEYKSGRRYRHCPDTSDILDQSRRPGATESLEVAQYDPANPKLKLFDVDLVPDRPHWVATDLTEPSGDWSPRRVDWEKVLVHGEQDDAARSQSESAEVARVVDAVRAVQVTDELRGELTRERPMGTYAQKPGCDYGGLRTIGDHVDAGDAPPWMIRALEGVAGHQSAPTDPVYEQSYGGFIFEHICANCHGPLGDSKGLQAEAVATMTGGVARVANFRDGIFGPGAAPGDNLRRVFVPETDNPAVEGGAQDWAARYLMWMALGGTRVSIPAAVLEQVSATRVLGVARPGGGGGASSPNMLNAAIEACKSFLPLNAGLVKYAHGSYRKDLKLPTNILVDTTGDAAMWRALCTLNNDSVVVVLTPTGEGATGRDYTADGRTTYWATGYPADAPVVTLAGETQAGLAARGEVGLCVAAPQDAAEREAERLYLDEHPLATGAALPFCPPALFAAGEDGEPRHRLPFSEGDGREIEFSGATQWARRGAANAGLAVFHYMEGIANGTLKPKPRYNECPTIK